MSFLLLLSSANPKIHTTYLLQRHKYKNKSGEAGRYIRSDCITIQVLQFLCQITADCLRPCFNRFFAVIPCVIVIGLRKILHEILNPARVLQAKLNDFLFIGGMLVDSRKILIHSKAHAFDKHHQQRNHGFLCMPSLTVRTFFSFVL